MSDDLVNNSAERLVLQQRVPSGFSATAEEHRWHDHPRGHQVDAKDLTITGALASRAALLEAVPARNDYELRVIVRRDERSETVLS